MEALNRLKAEANRSVVEGNRLFPDDASLPYFKKACAKYQEGRIIFQNISGHIISYFIS